MTASRSVEPASVSNDMTDVDSLPVMDFDHLASFTNGDQALETELAELYLSSAKSYLQSMQTSLEAERGWTAEAHGLKGASSNLGASRAAALAARAEFEIPTKAQFDALRLAVDDVAMLFAERGFLRP